MEKYVVDLDKALDELENDEFNADDSVNGYSGNGCSNLTSNHYQPDRSQHANHYFFERIDLNDADFAIQCKPPKILNNSPNVDRFDELEKLKNDCIDHTLNVPNICSTVISNLPDSNHNVPETQVANIEPTVVTVEGEKKPVEQPDSSVLCSELISLDCESDSSMVNLAKNEGDVINNKDSFKESTSVAHKQLIDLDFNNDLQQMPSKSQDETPSSEMVSEEASSLVNEDSEDQENVLEELIKEEDANQEESNQLLIKEIEAIQNDDRQPAEEIQESDSTKELNDEPKDDETKETVVLVVAEEKPVDKLTTEDINNMSESDLDKYLNDLDANSPTPPVDSECVEDVKCKDDNEIVVENVEEQSVIPFLSNETAESDEPDKTSAEQTVLDPNATEAAASGDIVVENEMVEALQSFEPTQINSEDNSESADGQAAEVTRPQTLPLSDEAETSQAMDNRGGLVQNIAYFERQEMPNGLTEEEQMLGKVKPFWIPDETAQNCLHCDVKFTMIKRRHHCRSCGKVLCSQCCNFKAKLSYLENKEARVCQLCYVILMRIKEIERINGHPIDISEINNTPDPGNSSLSINYPDPNNPSEYCSTISPFEQAAAESNNNPSPLTVMVPVGVLKRPGASNLKKSNNSDSSQGERNSELPVKQVIFSDGVRPGADLTETPSSSSAQPEVDSRPINRPQLHLKSPPADKPIFGTTTSVPERSTKRLKPTRVVVLDSNGTNLPPIVNYTELKRVNSNIPSKPSYSQLLELLRDSHLPHITFGITKNLFVNTKLISKICCNSPECWSFTSRGLASVGQDEVLLTLDCDSLRKPASTEQPQDDLLEFPRDIFRLLTMMYDSASKASLFTELSHVFFPDGLFGNKENSGFLFVRPTLQCFTNVLTPSPPFLIALLIHKWEIPWIKVFPLRLIFRLGYEYKMYPSPIISFANRKSVYFEIGHTIMNVLADFRNFQYTLTSVKDLLIHVEDRKRVNLLIPKLSYEKVCKVLSTSNEHVLAFGGNFSLKADSHFVCVQNEKDDDVQYHTKTICYPDSGKKVTGASFIVFSGALKSNTGLKAKMNIVEDGLLVQIPPTTMEELRNAIKDMKDFKIDCCKVADSEPSTEWIQINWINEELSTNLGVRSQIDGLNLEGVQSARIFSSPDYANERYLIRWIEVFLLQINENSRRSEMLNTNRLAESLSQAFCVALISYLDQLYESGLTKISLRISLDIDKVGYEAGSGGELLPSQFTRPLDNALIPAIMENISTTGIEDPLVIELLFYILLK